MVAWRYEISLRVLKNISRVSAAIFFNTRREILYISTQPCNILYLSFVFPEDRHFISGNEKTNKKNTCRDFVTNSYGESWDKSGEKS